jgi:PKD repeat protein
VSLDGSASSDSDGAIVSYAWDLGDGSTASGTVVSHTYADPGTYTATLTVIDDDGATDSAGVTITVTAPPPPPPPDELVISGITAASGKAYTQGVLAVGKAVYIDRSYTWADVGNLGGEKFILTANNDKASTGDSFLTFDVNVPVTVYVAFDVRSSTLPPWLQSWAATGEVLVTTDVKRNLYSRDFPAGTVTLGGNRPSGANSMYNAIVKPQ